MDIYNPQIFDHIKEVNGDVLKLKIINIGDWNMDLTAALNVAHGLTHSNIRDISVLIREDSGSFTTQLLTVWNTIASDGKWSIGGTYVTLSRTTGGVFDSALFSATSYNRGWVKIWYVV